MTYNVFGGTLNLFQSQSHSAITFSPTICPRYLSVNWNCFQRCFGCLCLSMYVMFMPPLPSTGSEGIVFYGCTSISYKLCSLMYQVVHGSAPTYLTELCQPCSDTRLRSTSRGDFIVPRFNRQLSNSSFSVAAPSAWNRLPLHTFAPHPHTLFSLSLIHI